jgi:Transferrin receptor-like dimerisation domain
LRCQTLTTARGLPGREWYKHLIYAPGMLTGYGVKTLPGVREFIEASKWEEANEYSTITAAALGASCDRLDLGIEQFIEAIERVRSDSGSYILEPAIH